MSSHTFQIKTILDNFLCVLNKKNENIRKQWNESRVHLDSEAFTYKWIIPLEVIFYMQLVLLELKNTMVKSIHFPPDIKAEYMMSKRLD